MQQLHLTLEEDSPAILWANAQADKIGARGHVGTHLDCYTTIPKQSEYEINGNVIDCKSSMPRLDTIEHIGSLENMALVLHSLIDAALQRNRYEERMNLIPKAYTTDAPSVVSSAARGKLFSSSLGLLNGNGSSGNATDAEANKEMVEILRMKNKRKRGMRL